MESTDKIVKRLNALTKRFPNPPKVVRFEAKDGIDWMGNPALFVLALLDDSTTPDDLDGRNLMAIRGRIFDAIHREGEPRWPFISFQTEAEHAQVNGT